MAVAEDACHVCGHDFPWFSGDGPEPRCPRCGVGELRANPWLLLSSEAEGLSDDDHYQAVFVV